MISLHINMKRTAAEDSDIILIVETKNGSMESGSLSLLTAIYDLILRGDAKTAKEKTREALSKGVDPIRIVQEFMTPAMKEAGRRFECREFFVPELMLSARAMKNALELIRPLLSRGRNIASAGRIVIGTVQGDLHDIGKNLVSGILEGDGYEIIDLGVNVPPESFVNATREQKADIVAMSALLTTTMPAMRTTIEALQQAGIRQQVKVLVGGAPITQEYANEIGADGYGDSAPGAVRIAREVLSDRS